MKKLDGYSFAKAFKSTWQHHRWRGAESDDTIRASIWTENLYKVLLKVSKKFQLTPDRELRRIDLTFYDQDEEPVLTVEHENGWQGIWDEEVPKLLASAAYLRVLICYPPKKQHDKIKEKLESRLSLTKKGMLNHEFLLIMGYTTMPTDERFSYFWFHPELKTSQLFERQ